jgi:lysophospholipase L1-like esterase
MDYPSQLSKLLGTPVINAGVPGDTTASALGRLERDVLSKAPDLVLITLGGNDLKNGVARDRAFENLRMIVASIQNTGATVIVGGIRFPMRDRGFGRAYEELADSTDAVLISNIFEGIMGNRKFMSDPIHPNDAGYKLIAEKFHETIRGL